MQILTDSSDDESDQHFAVATIATKKKGKEVPQMDTMIVNVSILITIILRRCLIII